MAPVLQFYSRLLLGALADLAAPRGEPAEVGAWKLRNFFLRRAGLRIASGTIVMRGMQALTNFQQYINIGENCVVGPMVKLWAFHRLEIGACTVIGPESSLTNGSHDPNSLEPGAKPLKVGRGCRIGHGARIVRGVQIGDLAIIEPGAVVTADVPEAAIVGGVPARLLGQREVAEQERLWGDRWYCTKTFQLCAPPAVGGAIDRSIAALLPKEPTQPA